MARITIKDLPKGTKISTKEMKRIYGGPNRREHDHIGQFNFKVEIEGVSGGTLTDLGGLIS